MKKTYFFEDIVKFILVYLIINKQGCADQNALNFYVYPKYQDRQSCANNADPVHDAATGSHDLCL